MAAIDYRAKIIIFRNAIFYMYHSNQNYSSLFKKKPCTENQQGKGYLQKTVRNDHLFIIS